MFKLNFDIEPSKTLLSVRDQVFSIGSCFSDHMAEKLAKHKFQVTTNPLGTIYNPHSIFKALGAGLDPQHYIQQQDIYYHWDTHGEVSATSLSELEALVLQKNQQIFESVQNANWLIITFGTSLAYRLKETNQIVANCHKVPQTSFEKIQLQPNEIIEGYHRCLKDIRKSNPDLKVILTVSPVRHIKDGLHENNISKGILHHAVAEIVRQDEQAFYFPSYEIMIDELRDYRFYKPDMIHPSGQAVDYIWEKFRHSCISPETNDFIDDWKKIQQGLNHRPFHPESENHQKFLHQLKKQIEKHAGTVNVKEETAWLNQQIHK